MAIGNVMYTPAPALRQSDVVDNLLSTATNLPGSANQLRVLDEKFENYLMLRGGTLTGQLYVNTSSNRVAIARIHSGGGEARSYAMFEVYNKEKGSELLTLQLARDDDESIDDQSIKIIDKQGSVTKHYKIFGGHNISIMAGNSVKLSCDPSFTLNNCFLTKDVVNMVNLELYLNSTTAHKSQFLIGTVPEGYRPRRNTAAAISVTGSNNAILDFAIAYIFTNGDIKIFTKSEIEFYGVRGNLSFKTA